MKYETFIENYTPQLQLIDALNMLKHYEPEAAEILDQWASEPNNGKNDARTLQKGPTPITFSQDTQLLSTDWEPQYKSQGDLINISSLDTYAEPMSEYPYLQHNTSPIQHDVYLSLDRHQTTRAD
jgi:hypothetical protein